MSNYQAELYLDRTKEKLEETLEILQGEENIRSQKVTELLEKSYRSLVNHTFHNDEYKVGSTGLLGEVIQKVNKLRLEPNAKERMSSILPYLVNLISFKGQSFEEIINSQREELLKEANKELESIPNYLTTIKRICKDYSYTNKSVKEIAKDNELTRSGVYEILQAISSKSKNFQRRADSNLKYEDLIEIGEFLDEGFSVEEIAYNYGKSTSTIYRAKKFNENKKLLEQKLDENIENDITLKDTLKNSIYDSITYGISRENTKTIIQDYYKNKGVGEVTQLPRYTRPKVIKLEDRVKINS